MGHSYNETDTASGCAVSIACSGLTLSTGTTVGRLADGTLGSTAMSFSIQKAGTQAIAVMFEIDPAAGTTWSAGTWTIRLDITTANTNLTWTDCYVCRVNSSCVSQATIGSASSLGISLGTTGVKSTPVTGSAQTPSAGDKILIVLAFTNSKTNTAQSASFTPDQAIDTPFSVTVTQAMTAAVVGSTATTAKQVEKLLTAAAVSSTATLIAGKLLHQALTASVVTATASLAHSVTFVHALTASAVTSTATFSKTVMKSLTASASSASTSFIKQTGKILSVSVGSTATIGQKASHLQSLTASSSSTASLAVVASYLRTLSAAVVTSVTSLVAVFSGGGGGQERDKRGGWHHYD